MLPKVKLFIAFFFVLSIFVLFHTSSAKAAGCPTDLSSCTYQPQKTTTITISSGCYATDKFYYCGSPYFTTCSQVSAGSCSNTLSVCNSPGVNDGYTCNNFCTALAVPPNCSDRNWYVPDGHGGNIRQCDLDGVCCDDFKQACLFEYCVGAGNGQPEPSANYTCPSPQSCTTSHSCLTPSVSTQAWIVESGMQSATIANGQQAHIAWTSSNALVCTASWNSSITATSNTGSTTGPLLNTKNDGTSQLYIFTVNCTNYTFSDSAALYVTVLPPSSPPPSTTASCTLTPSCASDGTCTFTSTYTVGGISQSSYQIDLHPDIANYSVQTGWEQNQTVTHIYSPGTYTAQLETRDTRGNNYTTCNSSQFTVPGTSPPPPPPPSPGTYSIQCFNGSTPRAQVNGSDCGNCIYAVYQGESGCFQCGTQVGSIFNVNADQNFTIHKNSSTGDILAGPAACGSGPPPPGRQNYTGTVYNYTADCYSAGNCQRLTNSQISVSIGGTTTVPVGNDGTYSVYRSTEAPGVYTVSLTNLPSGAQVIAAKTNKGIHTNPCDYWDTGGISTWCAYNGAPTTLNNTVIYDTQVSYSYSCDECSSCGVDTSRSCESRYGNTQRCVQRWGPHGSFSCVRADITRQCSGNAPTDTTGPNNVKDCSPNLYGACRGCTNLDTVTDFWVYSAPPIHAWWQTKGPDLYSGYSISSQAPSGKYLIEDPAGLSMSPGGTNAGAGQVSSTGWIPEAEDVGRFWGYQKFAIGAKNVNKTTVPPVITESTLTGLQPDSNGYKWAQYTGFDAATIGDINIGANKVVLFVDGNLTINGNIQYTQDQGFLAIISSGDINIASGVTTLQGLFVADRFIDTGTRGGAAQDSQLSVLGSIIAGNRIQLNRNLQSDNATLPAESIEFAPDLLTNMPQELYREGQNWQEVAP